MPAEDDSVESVENVGGSLNPLECLAQTAENYGKTNSSGHQSECPETLCYSAGNRTNAQGISLQECTTPSHASVCISSSTYSTFKPYKACSPYSKFMQSPDSAFNDVLSRDYSKVSQSLPKSRYSASPPFLDSYYRGLSYSARHHGLHTQNMHLESDFNIPISSESDKVFSSGMTSKQFFSRDIPSRHSVITSGHRLDDIRSSDPLLPDSPPVLFPIDQLGTKRENLLDTLLQESRKILSPTELNQQRGLDFQGCFSNFMGNKAIDAQMVSDLALHRKRIARKRKPKAVSGDEPHSKRSHMGPPFVPGANPPPPNTDLSATCTLHEYTLLKMATRGFWSGDRGPLQDVFRLSRVENADLSCSFEEITQHCFNVVRKKLEMHSTEIDVLHQYMRSYVNEFDGYLQRIYPVSSVTINIYLPTAVDYAKATWHGIVPTGWSEYRRAVVIREVFEILYCFGTQLHLLPKYERRFFDNPAPDASLVPIVLPCKTGADDPKDTSMQDSCFSSECAIRPLNNKSEDLPCSNSNISEKNSIDETRSIYSSSCISELGNNQPTSKVEHIPAVESSCTIEPSDVPIPDANRSRAFEAMWRQCSPPEPIIQFGNGETLSLRTYLERHPIETYCPDDSTTIMIDHVKYKANDVLGFFRRGVQLVDYNKESRTATVDTVSTIRKVEGTRAVRKIPPGKISKLIHPNLHLENYTSTIVPVDANDTPLLHPVSSKLRHRMRRKKPIVTASPNSKTFVDSNSSPNSPVMIDQGRCDATDSPCKCTELNKLHPGVKGGASQESYNGVSGGGLVKQEETGSPFSQTNSFNSCPSPTLFTTPAHACSTNSTSDLPSSNNSIHTKGHFASVSSGRSPLNNSSSRGCISSSVLCSQSSVTKGCQSNENRASYDIAFTVRSSSMATSDQACQTNTANCLFPPLHAKETFVDDALPSRVSVHTQTHEHLRSSITSLPSTSNLVPELGRLSSLQVMVDSYRRAAQYLLDTANQLELVSLGIKDEISCKPEDEASS